MAITDLYRRLPLNTTKHLVFSAAPGTFAKLNHILEHIGSLGDSGKI